MHTGTLARLQNDKEDFENDIVAVPRSARNFLESFAP